MKTFEVGNVVKTAHNSIIVLKEFRTSYRYVNVDKISYEVVHFDFLGDKMSSGSIPVVGYDERDTCGCWYEPFFRAYSSKYPDEDCEDCKGSGEIMKYRAGLNDCTLIASTVKDYKRVVIEDKIKKLQKKLEKL